MEKNYYLTQDQFNTLKTTWKAKTRVAYEHIMYNVLRDKPADSGFCVKTKNIQGNDPWFGFNSALRWAKRLCRTDLPSWQKRSEEDVKKWFKDRFGFDMPSTFMTKIMNISERKDG